MGRRRRIVIVLSALLVAAGGIWLLGNRPEPQLVAVLDKSFAPEEIAAVTQLLDARGIAHSSGAGVLRVEPEHVEQVRQMLACQGLLRDGPVADFEQLASQSDIWCTEAQNAKRWQAAKMAALSKLISMLPAVRSATVLFEPGVSRRLGAPQVGPTAAVKVHLADCEHMTPKLARAIADLVAGSIAGMDRQNVRIVDNTGQSYHVGKRNSALGGDRIERLQEAEAYYRERIRAALPYISDLAVGVRTGVVGDEVRCLGASVSVPRSYLVSVCHAADSEQDEVDDRRIQAVAVPQLAKIQQAVAKVLGMEPSEVAVDWYYDIPAARGESEFASVAEDSGPAWLSVRALAAGGLIVAVSICAMVALRRRRRRKSSVRPGALTSSRPEDSGEAVGDTARTDDESETVAGLFDFLRQASGEDLKTLLASEHPRTVALAMAHLPSPRAAEILANLSPDKQVDVAGRLATMEQMDSAVAREIARGLSGRLGDVAAGRQPKLGGVGAVAEILRHAGYATEKDVLDGLSNAEPVLAESIRGQMFCFEDIANMPTARLWGAMGLLDDEELTIALRTASEKVKRKIFACLSPEAARRVRENTRQMSPVRLSDVEAAQHRVIEAVRRFDRGKYVSALTGSTSELLA
ncbi:MAG: FliG C-terminal domain-containing protein [Planctomycetota bacterium]|nr:FliG C-terminal domain-containing protein [Planctomycetota bacterium]